MMRLAISVEGATEREFANRILQPHLVQMGIAVTAIDLRGNISLEKLRRVLPALLWEHDHVSTLYDFYGFKDRQERSADALEAAIHDLAPPEKRRFLTPYVQIHEFEALLFAIPKQSISHLGGSENQLLEMQQAVKRAGSAEQVNDSVATSPSHRIKKLFPAYDKKKDGPAIVQSAGLAAIRKECPRFNTWVSQLEKLATTPAQTAYLSPA